VNSTLVRRVIFPLHEKIMGRKTFAYLDAFERLQWATPEQLDALRLDKLKALLSHAKENIPFYRKRFAEAGFDPSRVQDTRDIRKIPLLTKEDIRKNLESLKWETCPGGLSRYNTGGSSGEPLIFYFDRRRQAYDKAARMLTHRWWDINVGDRELYLWGSPIEISKQDRMKELRDKLINDSFISAFEISREKTPRIIEKLRKVEPDCIFGYPSSISLLCRIARKMGLNLENMGVKVVFTTAEVLYEEQREIISAGFGGAPVADGYGSREAGFISHQCRYGTYHVMDPNYIIEYLKDGREVGPGEDGEIVITHLDTWGMPFIRYRTGDVAQFDKEMCKCGRHLSVMKKIQGRTTDFIITPDGRWQHGLSLIYVIRDIPGVAEFKIIQEAVNDIRVLLKTHGTLFPEKGEIQIIEGIKKRMGQEVKVNIETVDEIEKDASGKYRYVVSKVAEQGFK